MFQPLIVIYRRGILFIIIVDVHQFISLCLIHLDHWQIILSDSYTNKAKTYSNSEADNYKPLKTPKKLTWEKSIKI